MNTASMKETSAWVRMNPPRVCQQRVSASVRCQPTRRPVMRRIIGKNFSPSLRKKKVSTSMMNSVIRADRVADAPAATSDAMRPDWFCNQFVA